VTTPGLLAETYQAALLPPCSTILPSSFAVDAPLNPADLTFVGWSTSNGEPRASSLHQLSAASYVISMDDHSYADNSTNDRTMPQQYNTVSSMFFTCFALSDLLSVLVAYFVVICQL